MKKEEIDRIEFQAHGQDLRAIRFLRADHAALIAKVREISEGALFQSSPREMQKRFRYILEVINGRD